MSAAAPALKLVPEQRAAAIDELRALDELERRASSGKLEAFLFRYLAGAFSLRPGRFHRAIYADLEGLVGQTLTRDDEVIGETVPYTAAAYAYPRGHGKTTTITLGFLLWVIAEWHNMPHFQGEPPFILIVSDTRDNARDRAMDLRDEIEANELLREDYGDLVPNNKAKRGKTKWTEADWTTATGVRVKAVGSGSKVRGLLRRGRRPTLIVIDDLENDEAVATNDRRRKLERWLQKALIPTGIQGRLLTIAVGTILHADSLLSRLLDETGEHYPGWLKRRYAAQYNDAGLPDVDGSIALWPEGRPIRMLRLMRAEIGSVAYTQEFLNQPVDDETALFLRAWLRGARQRGKGLPFVYGSPKRIPFDLCVSTWDVAELVSQSEAGAYQVVVTAWDLGLVDDERKAQERDSDYSVGITVGLDAADRLHVRRIYRKRGMTPAQLRARVIAEQNLIGADYVAIENNAAQRIHEIDLRNIGLPVVGHTTDRRKHSVYEGVPGMAMLFELGRIDLAWSNVRERNRIDTMISELHELGHAAHDDTVMALWIAICTIRRWQRRRDKRRLKLLGPPPQGYVKTFPERHREAA